jgi:hypothetical protein
MGEKPADKKEYFLITTAFYELDVISPSVMVAFSKINEEITFQYTIERVVVGNFVISKSSFLVNIPKIFKWVLSRRVVVVRLAYDGRYKENPFNFENLGKTSMFLKVNSKSLPNTNGLEFDFVKNLYLDGYNPHYRQILTLLIKNIKKVISLLKKSIFCKSFKKFVI